MKIAFFGTKKYDKEYFNLYVEQYGHCTKFLKPKLTVDTASLAQGYDAVCAFVNDEVDADTIEILNNCGIKLILMRCAGYNNVDLKAAKKYGIKVLRVPGYSPEGVAEHAITIAMAANRKIHKAYNKVRDNNFSLTGLTGLNLYNKTAGIVGTGKIGMAMVRICKGFGMKVIAYDAYPNKDLDVEYVSLDYLLSNSDLISLHCPLFENTYHMINKDTIAMMKKGVILVNTSRGGLINTNDLIAGIKSNQFHAVALDVYEEESSFVFDNHSDNILDSTTVGRLLSFPNVILTSHQGFLSDTALCNIANITLQNATDFEAGNELVNEVTS